MKLSHPQIWSAIDALAEQNKLSVSRLAKNAGLDATTFNKSKRESSDGRMRWPSTESISKILDVTNTNWVDFCFLVSDDKQYFIDHLNHLAAGIDLPRISSSYSKNSNVPLVGFAEAGDGGYFDDAGFPAGHGWDEIEFPNSGEDGIYALEVSGDSMLPLYRDGDRIIVSPNSPLRRGDRVVVKTKEGEVLAKSLIRDSVQKIELQSLNPEHPDRSFNRSEIEWIARIIWASQ